MSAQKKHSLTFTVCLFLSIGLAIGGFLVPPQGVIDGSVLTAMGIILGFAVIDELPYVIHGHGNIRVNAGPVSIEANTESHEDNN